MVMRFEHRLIVGGFFVISFPIAGAFLYDVATGKKRINTMLSRFEKITTGRKDVRVQQREDYQKWREEKKLENQRKREVQEMGNQHAV